MDQLIATIVLGLFFGAPYALLALGIVLVYKGSRVFNFAQGEFGTVAAFAAYIANFWLPVLVAALVGILVGIAMGLGVERFVARPLANAPKVIMLVATAAVATGAIALQVGAGGGPQLRTFEPLVAGNAFVVFNVAIEWQRVLVMLALGLFALLLYLFFSRTDLGLAVMAASQEPVATDLVGIGTRRMSSLVWGMAGLLGGVTGVLFAGLQPFTPGVVTQSLLVFAFVAAVVGGMTSLPGAVIGGVVLGLVQSFSASYLTRVEVVAENLPNVEWLAVFVLLVAVLALRPSGLLGKEA